MIAKTQYEIDNLRTGGKILAQVLHGIAAMVRPGVNAAQLDEAAEEQIRAQGAEPSFLGYKPQGAKHPFPAALCVSLNDEVVHGLPLEAKVLHEGDIVSLDLGLSYKGFFLDHALTMQVGKTDTENSELIAATHEALDDAIAAAVVGGYTGDVGARIAATAKKYKLSAVKELGGHAVGGAVHEKPFVPNDSRVGEGDKITQGMVLAIEPMLASGKGDIVTADDDWTCLMKDGSRAAHFEHTVLVTKNGPEILTKL